MMMSVMTDEIDEQLSGLCTAAEHLGDMAAVLDMGSDAPWAEGAEEGVTGELSREGLRVIETGLSVLEELAEPERSALAAEIAETLSSLGEKIADAFPRR